MFKIADNIGSVSALGVLIAERLPKERASTHATVLIVSCFVTLLSASNMNPCVEDLIPVELQCADVR
jgi:hypothetical protein